MDPAALTVIASVAAKAIADALAAGGYITLRKDELLPPPLTVFKPPQE